eukprot:Platyproteum_vivax@DN6206_c1_g1_i1.p1
MPSWGKRTIGFALLGAVVFLWVGSALVIQKIFEDVHYGNSVFMTMVQTSMFAVLTLQCKNGKCNRDFFEENSVGVKRSTILHLAVLWILGQTTFNWSLMRISFSSMAVLSCTGSMFTFFLCLYFLGHSFNLLPFGGVLITMVGVVLVGLFSPKTIGNHIPDTTIGQVVCVFSAFVYAFFTVMLKRAVPNEKDVNMGYLFACIGFISMMLGPVVVYFADLTFEPFFAPSKPVIIMLICNGLLGGVLSNYLWSWSILYLSPLMAIVGLNTQMPISILLDGMMGDHTFTNLFLLGSVLVFVGVIIVSLDTINLEEDHLSDSELESVLGYSQDSTDLSEIVTHIEGKALAVHLPKQDVELK